MTDRRWRTWETVGLLVVLALGNLLHFVYSWSGHHPLAAVFAAVNESTWEHMKIFAMPWILWSLVEWLALRRTPGSVLPARALGLLTGLALIPVLFYTYRGIWGRNLDFVNISIFQAAVLLAFFVSWTIQRRRLLRRGSWQVLGFLVLAGVGALFVYWTYRTPQLPVFLDPRTGLPGIPTG